MKRIAIIGGGITGLTCAYQLAQAGHRVDIYEKGNTIGGLAGSYRSGDFIFDYGPHEFCTDNPELVDLLSQILGDDLLVREKNAAQYFNNKYVNYPLAPIDVIRQLNPLLTMRVTAEVILQRLKSLVYSYSDHSFEKWVANRFGKTLYNEYFGPYTEKVWGIDPDKLDPRTASSRISFNSIFDYLIKTTAYFLFKKNDFSTIHSPLKDKFYYARRGIGTLTDNLAQKCQEAGVRFYTGYGLTHVTQINNVVKELHFDNGDIVTNFDYMVNTIPITALLSAMGHPCDNLPIRFRSMILAFLEIPKPQMSPFSWIYVPNKEICFQRSTEFSHFEADMAPKGHTGVCLEISCFPEDDIWQASDEAVEQRVRQDMAKVGLLDPSMACKMHIVRKKFIYPIQVIGHLEMIHELLTPVRALKNGVTTGRQGLYKYCNMNECMEMAIEVANQIDASAETFKYELDTKWRGAGLEETRVLTTVRDDARTLEKTS